jgi:hypothetical protein
MSATGRKAEEAEEAEVPIMDTQVGHNLLGPMGWVPGRSGRIDPWFAVRTVSADGGSSPPTGVRSSSPSGLTASASSNAAQVVLSQR